MRLRYGTTAGRPGSRPCPTFLETVDALGTDPGTSVGDAGAVLAALDGAGVRLDLVVRRVIAHMGALDELAEQGRGLDPGRGADVRTLTHRLARRLGHGGPATRLDGACGVAVGVAAELVGDVGVESDALLETQRSAPTLVVSNRVLVL